MLVVQRAPAAGRRGRHVPRVRRDAARPEDDDGAPVRGARRRSPIPRRRCSVYPRFRGRHRLHRFEDTGLEKCVGCSLCAAACPADCIRVVAAENTPENRVSAGERYAAVYEINLSRCIFCGYCEVACPFDAITMGHDYEMSAYNRHGSDLHEGDAARGAARAHAAARRGRVARHRTRLRPAQRGLGRATVNGSCTRSVSPAFGLVARRVRRTTDRGRAPGTVHGAIVRPDSSTRDRSSEVRPSEEQRPARSSRHAPGMRARPLGRRPTWASGR